MSNITIGILFLFVVVWVYSLNCVFTNEFEDEKAKVFWRIAIIFVPILSIFYLFMKKNLHK